jgi:hypothetical protein
MATCESSIVGFCEVLQQKPISVIVEPPSSITVPLHNAELIDEQNTSCVTTVGKSPLGVGVGVGVLFSFFLHAANAIINKTKR